MANFSVIPRHAAAVVTVNDFGMYTMLWKDSQTIIIQRQSIPSEFIFGEDQYDNIIKHNNDTVEIIQHLLDHSKFGVMNWGYLVSSPGGGHRIIYRNRQIPRIECRTWAPLVDISEINITHWVTFYMQFATWKGRRVQIMIAWEDLCAERVQDFTYAHEALVGLDVSLEVLGHILRDGEVVGLILEPTQGRVANWGDRALIHAAVARMKAHGLFFDSSCSYDAANIIISDEGKVRFLGILSVNLFDEGADTERMNEYMDHLDRMLQCDNGLGSTVSLLTYVDRGQRCDLLPPFPHPERPILSMRDILLQLKLYYIPPFDDDVFFSFVGEMHGKRKHPKRHSITRFIAPESDGGPLASGSSLSIRRRGTSPLVIASRRRPVCRRKPLIIFNEDSDALDDHDVPIEPSSPVVD